MYTAVPVRLAALPDVLLRRAVPNLTDSSPRPCTCSTGNRDQGCSQCTNLVTVLKPLIMAPITSGMLQGNHPGDPKSQIPISVLLFETIETSVNFTTQYHDNYQRGCHGELSDSSSGRRAQVQFR
jgi:hypothetical protein